MQFFFLIETNKKLRKRTTCHCVLGILGCKPRQSVSSDLEGDRCVADGAHGRIIQLLLSFYKFICSPEAFTAGSGEKKNPFALLERGFNLLIVLYQYKTSDISSIMICFNPIICPKLKIHVDISLLK